jgi:hypothetical protein
MSGVHHFYDFAAFYLLALPVCLIFWPLLLMLMPLISTPESCILILFRYPSHACSIR